MRTVGKYAGASRSLQGELIISFAINDESAIENIDSDKQLVIETKRYSDKRSLNANAYFWVLCDKIANELRSTKEAVYLLQLSKYGVWVDVTVKRSALPGIKAKFRYTEEFIEDSLSDGEEVVTVRCYFGSSHYDKSEMSRLIEGTVRDAKEIGNIDTWTPDEISRAIAAWEGDVYVAK